MAKVLTDKVKHDKIGDFRSYRAALIRQYTELSVMARYARGADDHELLELVGIMRRCSELMLDLLGFRLREMRKW